MTLGKNFRLILGGKPASDDPPDGRSGAVIAQLRKKTRKFRYFLSLTPNAETAELVRDMEEAIEALEWLERTRHGYLRRRAADYRRLIAEIEAEILVALDM
jgi:hypothetical protein